MIYPGSFIWERMPDKWLTTRTTAISFGVFSIVIVAMTVVIYRDIEVNSQNLIVQVLLGMGGVGAAVGVPFVWGGMWRYWIELDGSSRMMRRASFAVLLVGLWYGAILYYLVVYLPSVSKHEVFSSRAN